MTKYYRLNVVRNGMGTWYNLYLSSEKKIKFEIASGGLSGKWGSGPRVSLEEITKREFENARSEEKALRDAAFKTDITLKPGIKLSKHPAYDPYIT